MLLFLAGVATGIAIAVVAYFAFVCWVSVNPRKP